MIQSIMEWLGREGGLFLTWWVLVTLAGVVTWPLTFRILRGLPDRGYTLARTVGLITIGYVFWLAASLGLLTNTSGSVLLAALVVLAIGAAALERQAMLEWVRDNWKYMVFVEALFLILFFAWTVVRAANPALTGTEKPMEVAFTSAIQRSASFPPNDPWMSGYAISYYYFGYVIAATLGTLSGASSTVAFNLMIPLLFALTGMGVFGVVYNLLRLRFLGHRRRGSLEPTSRKVALAFGLLGVVFVILLGNLHTVLVEIPYEQGWASEGYLSFWDESERDYPRIQSAAGVDEWDHWWWFRASRVIRDRDLNGEPSGIQPIDEFPAFSFVLADMHPHVLALPWAALALALALNVALSHQAPSRDQVVAYGLFLGALVFLNTWDGPIYIALLVGAEALRRLVSSGTGRLSGRDWWPLVRLGLVLVGLAVLFYLPFLISFRSQLGGVLPNLIHPTRIHQFFLMFGPFVVILLFFLAVEIWRGQEEMDWKLAVSIGVLGLLGLVLISVVLGVIAWTNPSIRTAVYSAVDAAGGFSSVLGSVVATRLAGVPLLVMLGGVITVVIARLFGRPVVAEDGTPYAGPTGFVLLLVGAGAVLALAPDYLYLRDNFSVRINTVFKFYYQVWLIWGVASAYAAYSILFDVEWQTRPSNAVRAVFGVAVSLLLLAGLAYPVLAVYSRTVVIREGGRLQDEAQVLTLDGGPTLATRDDYAALTCLSDLVGDDDAVLLEAVGLPYQPHLGGRVSALTGIPTVLAWEGHEAQWRGSAYGRIAASRPQDVTRIYDDPNWATVESLVDRYGIDYIFVGSAELNAFDPFGLAKFEASLTPVCRSGETTVYRVNN